MRCPVGTDVARAAQLLREGRLVAIPTETVYGLGANALDPQAVAGIFAAKNRPRFDPLIVHVADPAQLDDLVAEFSASARLLAERFWPGPLTLVFPKTDRVPDLVTAGLATVAVRIPRHPLALQLLRETGLPIAAPSANPFGRVSPTCAEHVAEQLGDRIDYILDGGPCAVGVESTVLDPTSTPPRLLRPGGVPLEDLIAAIGPIEIATTPDQAFDESSSEAIATPSPGMLSRHYAPTTPLTILAESSVEESHRATAAVCGGVQVSVGTGGSRVGSGRIGLLTFSPPDDAAGYAAIEVLAPDRSLTTAAANFFAALRRLDALGLDAIHATSFPETGLGCALNDRLRRASQRS